MTVTKITARIMIHRMAMVTMIDRVTASGAGELGQLLTALDRLIARMQEASLRPSANPHISYDKADLIADVRMLVQLRAALAAGAGTDAPRADDEAHDLRDRIRRLREAIRTVGRGGLPFVERYMPHATVEGNEPSQEAMEHYEISGHFAGCPHFSSAPPSSEAFRQQIADLRRSHEITDRENDKLQARIAEAQAEITRLAAGHDEYNRVNQLLEARIAELEVALADADPEIPR